MARKSEKKRTLSKKIAENMLDFNLLHKRKRVHLESDVDSHLNVSLSSSDNTQVCLKFNKCNRLSKSFFNQPCISLAKALLGKVLVRKLETGEILKGRIVETECYLGSEDGASHSYKGKRTERNEAMFMDSGTVYVYSIYGMYFCFNISSYEEGSAVLIRALEPLIGNHQMNLFRCDRRKTFVNLKDKELCSGPSKLCQALNISKHAHNKIDLSSSNELWVEEGFDVNPYDIISCKRIGIDSSGEEWANKPLRFYIRNCIWVSIRNKQAEKMQSTHLVKVFS